MTEQPQQDAAELLRQIFEALQQAKAENESLKREISALKEEIPKMVDAKVNELGDATTKGFEKVSAAFIELKNNSLAVPQQPQGGGNKLFDQIGNMLEKAFTGTGAQQSNDFLNEMEATYKDIMKLNFKEMLYAARDRAKAAGIPVAEHIVVDVGK